MKIVNVLLLALVGLVSAGELSLPKTLEGKVQVLSSSDPDYAKAVVANAIKPAGDGGVSQAVVIKLTEDMTVYRLWNGPAVKDSRGNTNRMGSWWAFDAPTGPVAGYRNDYEVCNAWNQLTWVATCTLKKGSVVAVGPGQSVSAMTCGDPTGKESYPENAAHWQVYIDKAWSRSAELVCPPDSADYEANPSDISKKK